MGACREVPRWINSSATQRREGFDLHKRNSSPSYRERQLHGDTRNSTLERKSILQSNAEFTCSIETFFFNHSVFHSTTLNQRGGGEVHDLADIEQVSVVVIIYFNLAPRSLRTRTHTSAGYCPARSSLRVFPLLHLSSFPRFQEQKCQPAMPSLSHHEINPEHCYRPPAVCEACF